MANVIPYNNDSQTVTKQISSTLTLLPGVRNVLTASVTATTQETLPQFSSSPSPRTLATGVGTTAHTHSNYSCVSKVCSSDILLTSTYFSFLISSRSIHEYTEILHNLLLPYFNPFTNHDHIPFTWGRPVE